jgi:hypothetical protein
MGENPETTSAFLVCCLMEAEMGFEENLADSKQRLASMVDILFLIEWSRFVWRTRWLASCAWVYVTGKISKN